VRAYLGSAEILGTLVMDEPIASAEVRARLNLREEIVAFSGLRFVLRRPSPMTLLGGGFVEDIEPAAFDDARDPSEDAALAVLHARKLEPSTRAEVAFGANLREEAADAALTRLVETGDAIRVERPAAYVEAEAARTLFASVTARLDDTHRAEPWAMGETSIALARATGAPEASLVRILEHFVAEGRLANRAGYYAALDFRPALDAEQRAFFERLIPLDDAQPLLPTPFAGAAAAVRRSQVAGVAKAFDTLFAQGALVKIGDDLYRGSQIAQIRSRIEMHFVGHPRMTAAEFRDLLGTSRKHAVPLLEWLDTHGVTIRDGNYRTLRRREIKR
jgi:selenocysteine-specific elongation factor